MTKIKKHPFKITCKICGSHNIRISAEDWNDIELRCEDCGTYTNCGVYHGKNGDYTRCTVYGENKDEDTEWYD